jgi:hypothetical protein
MSHLVIFLHCKNSSPLVIQGPSYFKTFLTSGTVTHGFRQKSVKSTNHASMKIILLLYQH